MPMWLLSALYTLFDKKQSENDFSFTKGHSRERLRLSRGNKVAPTYMSFNR